MQDGYMKRRAKVWISIIGLILAGMVGGRLLLFKWMSGPGFWAGDIAVFAANDRDHPPPDRPVVFVGSSSIRLWSTLQADMAPLPVLNRGFGGSQLSQVVYYVDQTVIRYRPRAIVLYAGDNDLDGRYRTGKTPEDVAREFLMFVARVEAAVPDARIYYLSMKPSRQRWTDWPQEHMGNTLIAKICAGDPRLAYIDVATPMLAAGTPPPSDLFMPDGMHPSPKGYAQWTAIIKPRLQADLTPPARPKDAASSEAPETGGPGRR
jgi:lysophospholipase L1-like esterase